MPNATRMKYGLNSAAVALTCLGILFLCIAAEERRLAAEWAAEQTAIRSLVDAGCEVRTEIDSSPVVGLLLFGDQRAWLARGVSVSFPFGCLKPESASKIAGYVKQLRHCRSVCVHGHLSDSVREGITTEMYDSFEHAVPSVDVTFVIF